jgi:hypothetical protein
MPKMNSQQGNSTHAREQSSTELHAKTIFLTLRGHPRVLSKGRGRSLHMYQGHTHQIVRQESQTHTRTKEVFPSQIHVP